MILAAPTVDSRTSSQLRHKNTRSFQTVPFVIDDIFACDKADSKPPLMQIQFTPDK